MNDLRRRIESGSGRGAVAFEAKKKKGSTEKIESSTPPSLADWLKVLPPTDGILAPALRKIQERRRKPKKRSGESEDNGSGLGHPQGGRKSPTGETVDRSGKVKSNPLSE